MKRKEKDKRKTGTQDRKQREERLNRIRKPRGQNVAGRLPEKSRDRGLRRYMN